MDSIVCLVCETVTATWVMRCEQYVEEVDFFCSNDCLLQWLLRLKTAVEDRS